MTRGAEETPRDVTNDAQQNKRGQRWALPAPPSDRGPSVVSLLQQIAIIPCTIVPVILVVVNTA